MAALGVQQVQRALEVQWVLEVQWALEVQWEIAFRPSARVRARFRVATEVNACTTVAASIQPAPKRARRAMHMPSTVATVQRAWMGRALRHDHPALTARRDPSSTFASRTKQMPTEPLFVAVDCANLARCRWVREAGACMQRTWRSALPTGA